MSQNACYVSTHLWVIVMNKVEYRLQIRFTYVLKTPLRVLNHILVSISEGFN